MSKPTFLVQTRLSASDHAELQALAKRMGHTVASAVRDAVRHYLTDSLKLTSGQRAEIRKIVREELLDAGVRTSQ